MLNIESIDSLANWAYNPLSFGIHMVASMQIGTMLDPCTYLSDSDSDFEFCGIIIFYFLFFKKNTNKNCETYWSTKPRNLRWYKKNLTNVFKI